MVNINIKKKKVDEKRVPRKVSQVFKFTGVNYVCSKDTIFGLLPIVWMLYEKKGNPL